MFILFQGIGLDELMMHHIINQNLQFPQVLDVQNPGLYQLFDQYSSAKKKAIVAVCRNLKDVFGIENVFLTHQGYYQPFKVDLRCGILTAPIENCQLQRGTTLEIFQAEPRCDANISILEQMKADCLKIVQPPKLYANLPIRLYDTCVTLKLTNQEYEVTRLNGTILTTESFDFGDHLFFMEELFDQYQRVLTLIPK